MLRSRCLHETLPPLHPLKNPSAWKSEQSSEVIPKMFKILELINAGIFKFLYSRNARLFDDLNYACIDPRST